MSYTLPFLSVLLGYLISILIQPKNNKSLKLLLAFSGSFLLSITVIDLLPEIYESQNKNIGIYIMVGILFQIFLEFFSQGAEHGHVHAHKVASQTPWLLFLSLCIHAFLEGFPVNRHQELSIGIAIHHLPIAIILASFFINANLNKKIVATFMLSFALMTPLGTFFANYLTALNNYYSQITAVVVGILFHISSTIIFESNEDHKFNFAKISMIGLGIFMAWML